MHTDIQTYVQTYRHTDIQTYRQTDGRTDGRTDRPTDGQTDRQTTCVTTTLNPQTLSPPSKKELGFQPRKQKLRKPQNPKSPKSLKKSFEELAPIRARTHAAESKLGDIGWICRGHLGGPRESHP